MPQVFNDVIVNYAVKPLVTLTNGTTIDPANAGIIPVTCTANVTGIIIAAGADGQQVILQNQGGYTVSFAASSVAGITAGDFLSAGTQRRFNYDATRALWWRVSGWALFGEGG